MKKNFWVMAGLSFALFSPILLACDGQLCNNARGANAVRVLPVDEGKDVSDFNEFRNKLLEACRRKDLQFLTAHTDERIHFTFSLPPEEQNREKFLKFWEADSAPARSQIWDALDKIIVLGGIFENSDTFVAPYTFAKFPDALDGFTSLVCVSSGVPLHDKPSTSARIIKKLDYEIVAFNPAESAYSSVGELWIKVKTFSGEEGYVFKKYFERPIDYRAVFRRKNRIWKITDFIAGD